MNPVNKVTNFSNGNIKIAVKANEYARCDELYKNIRDCLYKSHDEKQVQIRRIMLPKKHKDWSIIKPVSGGGRHRATFAVDIYKMVLYITGPTSQQDLKSILNSINSAKIIAGVKINVHNNYLLNAAKTAA